METVVLYSFGDLNVDSVWRFSRSISNNLIDLVGEAECTIRCGGVAFNFFEAAAEVCREAVILGKVGSDDSGLFIRQKLSANQGHFIAIDPRYPTGSTALFQFTSPSVSVNRLVVYNSPNANQYLTVDEIEAFNLQITSSDILFLTGYSLFRSPVQHAAFYLMDKVRAAGAKVVFDILPHDLSAVGPPAKLLRLIKRALGQSCCLCISEYRTLCYLFDTPIRESIDTASLEELGRRACEISRFVSIRYGLENCDREAIFHNGQALWDADTHYADLSVSDRLAYGDKLTLSLVEQLLLGSRSWPNRPGLHFTVPLDTLDLIPSSTLHTSRIIDIGCGYGRAYSKLLSLGFTNIFGLDSALSLVTRAQRDYPEEQYPSIRTLQGTIHTAVLENERFDIAILLGTLTGFQFDRDIILLFEKIHQLLDPKGLFLIVDFSISDSAEYRSRYENFVHKFPEACYGTMISPHGGITRHFQSSYLISQLTFGFRLVQSQN